MSSVATLARSPDTQVLRTIFRQHPEWWTCGLGALAWCGMAPHALQVASHGMHHRMPFAGELWLWLLMVYAMMLPLVVREARAVAFASLWSRRHRAIAGFLAGYSLVWLLPGIPTAWARGQAGMHTYLAPVIGFLVAALWQLSPMHAFAFAACHRSPIPAASGWRADRDCVLFGVRIGWACLLTCWPLMLACALTGHALIAMVGCLGLGWAERQAYRPRFGIAAAGAAALAGYCFLRRLG